MRRHNKQVLKLTMPFRSVYYLDDIVLKWAVGDFMSIMAINKTIVTRHCGFLQREFSARQYLCGFFIYIKDGPSDPGTKILQKY